MSLSKSICFSDSGSHLAYSGPDGILRIWDTQLGVLEQEFQPVEHLTAKITCVQFAPTSSSERKREKKKKKKSLEKGSASEIQTEGLVALGTVSGAILLYSRGKQEVVKSLKQSASSIVDISWLNQSTFLSLAADNTLVEWEVHSGKLKRAMETPDGTAVCHLGSSCIIVGRTSICLYDLTEKGIEIKKGFTGHTSDVTQLLAITTEVGRRPTYFLSSAQDDRFVYVWSSTSSEEVPTTSLMVKDTVTCVSISQPRQDCVMIAVATFKGSLVLFNHHFNGSKGDILRSSGRLSLVASEMEGKKLNVPIKCSCFTSDFKPSIIVAYGSSGLRFEKIDLETIVGNVVLVREEPAASRSKNKRTSEHTAVQITDRDVMYLQPSLLPVTKPFELKRKHGEEDATASLPMEQRLSALSINKATSNDPTKPPQGDNMTHLLLQGLHSKDKGILYSVLNQGSNEDIVNNTVKRMPLESVVPFLRQLHSIILGKGNKSCVYVTWVRAVLYHHMSHLSALPDREELMEPFSTIGAARQSTFPEMLKLHARLDLLLTHIAARHEASSKIDAEPEALLVYKNDSSDEDDMDVPPEQGGVTESEDNWDELSEFGNISEPNDDDSEMSTDDSYKATLKRKIQEEEEGVLLSSDAENSEVDDDRSGDDNKQTEVNVHDADEFV